MRFGWVGQEVRTEYKINEHKVFVGNSAYTTWKNLRAVEKIPQNRSRLMA
jgi:hypothetical protein